MLILLYGLEIDKFAEISDHPAFSDQWLSGNLKPALNHPSHRHNKLTHQALDIIWNKPIIWQDGWIRRIIVVNITIFEKDVVNSVIYESLFPTQRVKNTQETKRWSLTLEIKLQICGQKSQFWEIRL